MGAYAGLIKSVTLQLLRRESLLVLDYERITDSPHLEQFRVDKLVSSFTTLGRMCLVRARLEAERRFCGSMSETVDGTCDVLFSDSE